MNKNIGKTDKILRIVIAVLFAYLVYSVSPWYYIITVIALVTSLISWCGLYSLLGISTIKKSKASKGRK